MEYTTAMWCSPDGESDSDDLLEEMFCVNNGSNLMVARGSINVNGQQFFVPGTIKNGDEKCFVAFEGKIHECKTYETLYKQENYLWLASTQIKNPKKIILGTHSVKMRLFIGRVLYHGEYFVGSVDTWKKFCSIVVDGKIIKERKFELLVEEENQDQDALKSIGLAFRHQTEQFTDTKIKFHSYGEKPKKKSKKVEDKKFANFKAKPAAVQLSTQNLKDFDCGPKKCSSNEEMFLSFKINVNFDQPPLELKTSQQSSIQDEINNLDVPEIDSGIVTTPAIFIFDESQIIHETFIRSSVEITDTSLVIDSNIIISQSQNELKLKFSNVNSILRATEGKSFNILTFVDVPSTDEALNILKHQDFLVQNQNSPCREIHMKIIDDQMRFLKTSDWFNLSGLYSKKEKSMMILFNANDKFQVGWKAANKEKMMNLPIGEKNGEKNEKIDRFIVEYLRKSLENGHSGITSERNPDTDLNCLLLTPCALYDERGYSLLMIAAEKGDLNAVNYFLKHGADESFEINNKIAIDLVDVNSDQYNEIVLSLLKENSRFPRNFDTGLLTDDLKSFVEDMKKMHLEIKEGSKEEVRKVIERNPNLRYFFKPKNNTSAYTAAEKYKQFEILKLFKEKSLLRASFEMGRFRATSDGMVTLQRIKNSIEKPLRRGLSAPAESKRAQDMDLTNMPTINERKTEDEEIESIEVNPDQLRSHNSDEKNEDEIVWKNLCCVPCSFLVTRHRKERNRLRVSPASQNAA